MATKKAETISLVSEDPKIAKPRLAKLVVKNYRCIGSTPVEIELDDIVVLVGGNNTGKSSILRAYKLAMSQGSNDAKLKLDDFPNGLIDPANYPEIEIWTVVYDNTVGSRWIDTSTGERLVKEHWIWQEPEAQPKREGWDVTNERWSDEVPWGAPNIANTFRPEPHIIDAFASPKEQADQIVKILKQEIDARVKSYKESTEEESEYSKLKKKIGELQKHIVGEAQDQIDAVNKELSTLICQVFPDYKVDFDAKPEDDLDKAISFFKSDAQLLMGFGEGHMSNIEKQGSGARRTLLWAAVKFIAENTQKAKDNSSRPHLLLIDEPEICLHPSAIRDACNALYSLPNTEKWQVMATTHSPIFVDFSKDNTTIVRVERNQKGEVRSTTVFKPKRINLDEDDKQNLKLLNMCDPYVAEFFFGGRTLIVEGDTEYTAFNYVKSQDTESYRDVHIIRARGKATIVSLIKILNGFGASYSVLHDSDRQKTKDGKKKNPAWTNNQNIITAALSNPTPENVRVFASVPNFEEAYFGASAASDKPYKALKEIMDDPKKFAVIKNLIDALLGNMDTPPANCVEWNNIKQLLSLEETAV